MLRLRARRVSVTAWAVPPALLAVVALTALASLPTTLMDFHQPGTQPNTLVNIIVDANNCAGCHRGYDEAQEPWTRWAASMMGQSGRDPVFYACLAIANQDAAFTGDLCLRCHTPGGWVEGHSFPTDGSSLTNRDRQGVSCSFCHRMVDPVADPANPAIDAAILAAIPGLNPNPHGGQYVIDPQDRRRGPFDLDPNFIFHTWHNSPYHRESLMCSNCHDVSNPLYTKQLDGSYDLGPYDTEHPTHNKFDQFPLERTYSEWSVSAFAAGPVEMGGRFGGNITAVSSCQDCHMPKTSGVACLPDLNIGIFRDDLPQHDFNGANSWVLNAVRATFSDNLTGLTDDSMAGAAARTLEMLQDASDMELTQLDDDELNVRIINQSGHKLPTGYPEGRRMWLNVRFYNASGTLLAERGAYDTDTAILSTDDTKVYEGKLGVDAEAAAVTGLPVGESFHLALNNTWYKDNRIPPRGFTNAAFAAVQAAPVDYTYEDGQYWDDTQFAIPPDTCRAEVTLNYQTTSKEYIEFLRDANFTNSAGLNAYNLWVQFGKSAPVVMDNATLFLPIPGDLNDDGIVDLTDLTTVLSAYGISNGGDLNGDDVTDLLDLTLLLSYFGSHCP